MVIRSQALTPKAETDPLEPNFGFHTNPGSKIPPGAEGAALFSWSADAGMGHGPNVFAASLRRYDSVPKLKGSGKARARTTAGGFLVPGSRPNGHLSKEE